MRLRVLCRAAVAVALLSPCAESQTWSNCNPLQSSSCPADTALGMAIDVDFTKGPVNSFAASDGPLYNQSGVAFVISAGGQAPQLASIFYIMFGRVEVRMRAAAGAGIVSSLVLQSDDLDEIDVEWLGAQPTQLQTNYFGRGQTGAYNRGQFHNVPVNTQSPDPVLYTVDWTRDRIVWTVAGTQIRQLLATDADPGQYPQTPMQVKFGAWAGGDPAYNAPGTVAWAQGPTDYSKGPFAMVVSSLSVTDYSTGTQYRYSDQSGNWQSIVAVGGDVDGNLDAAGEVTVTASAAAASGTAEPSVPVGIGTATSHPGSQPTIGSIPAGWRMTASGKVVPIAAALPIRPPWLLLLLIPALLAIPL